MTIREIATIGHPVLRERAREVTPEELRSPEIQRLIDDMIETMRAARGAGLAANQVREPVRIAGRSRSSPATRATPTSRRSRSP